MEIAAQDVAAIIIIMKKNIKKNNAIASSMTYTPYSFYSFRNGLVA